MGAQNPDRRWDVGEKQILIDFTELDRIEITCKKCGTGVVLSANKLAPELKANCPGCSAPFHDMSSAVSMFRDFYATAERSENKAVFRIKVQENT